MKSKLGHQQKVGIRSPHRYGVQQSTAVAETTIAETTTIEDKLSDKTTVLEEIELSLFTGFEDTTALEDKKSLL